LLDPAAEENQYMAGAGGDAAPRASVASFAKTKTIAKGNKPVRLGSLAPSTPKVKAALARSDSGHDHKFDLAKPLYPQPKKRGSMVRLPTAIGSEDLGVGSDLLSPASRSGWATSGPDEQASAMTSPAALLMGAPDLMIPIAGGGEGYKDEFASTFGMGGGGGAKTTLQLAARSLDAKDSNGSSDPFFVLKVGKKQIYKSETIKSNLSPTWKEFEVDTAVLTSANLTVDVFDWDRLSRNDLIGSASIAPQTAGDSWSLMGKAKRGQAAVAGTIYVLSLNEKQASASASALGAGASGGVGIFDGSDGSAAADASRFKPEGIHTRQASIYPASIQPKSVIQPPVDDAMKKIRKAAAKELLQYHLLPTDVARFAVTTLAYGADQTEQFEINAAASMPGEVLLSATSPDTVIAALGWYTMQLCKTPLNQLKSRGLPAILPRTQHPIRAKMLGSEGGKQAWRLLPRLAKKKSQGGLSAARAAVASVRSGKAAAKKPPPTYPWGSTTAGTPSRSSSCSRCRALQACSSHRRKATKACSSSTPRKPPSCLRPGSLTSWIRRRGAGRLRSSATLTAGFRSVR
jgi:hypothetical protein